MILGLKAGPGWGLYGQLLLWFGDWHGMFLEKLPDHLVGGYFTGGFSYEGNSRLLTWPGVAASEDIYLNDFGSAFSGSKAADPDTGGIVKLIRKIPDDRYFRTAAQFRPKGGRFRDGAKTKLPPGTRTCVGNKAVFGAMKMNGWDWPGGLGIRDGEGSTYCRDGCDAVR